jgi:predicted acyltransferase
MIYDPGTKANTLSNRIPELDLLRGITIVLMIIASYHGDVSQSFSSLVQTFGCGLRIADLVVPAFFWIIGLSLSLSISSRLAKGVTRYQLLSHVLARSALLYIVGLALDASTCLDNPDRFTCLFESRLFGIFQRIALSYLCAAPVVIFTGWKGQFSMLMATCLGYQLYVNGLDLQPCDPTYRRTLMTIIPGMSLILAGSLAGFFVRPVCNVQGSHILAILGSLLILGSLALNPSIPFFFQQLNSTSCLLSAGVATLLFATLNMAASRWLGKSWAALLIALGQNPLILYIISALLYSAGHAIGVHQSPNDWISIWHYGWMISTSLLGDPKLASLLMSLILLTASAGIAWLLSRNGIVIKI